MTILNMVGGGASGPKVPLNAISVIAAVGGNTEATITWTDPSDIVVNGVTVTTWSSTKLVRKVGSAPTSISDGTLVLTETTRNTYSSTGYEDTGLTNGTTYYYAAFAIADNGLATISSTTPSVTPEYEGWQPGVNTVAYYPLTADTNDYSGNSRNLTNSGVTFVNNIGGATVPVGYWDGSDKSLRSRDVQLSGGYTISWWSKVNSSSNTGIMLDLRNEVQQGQGFLLGRCANNQISFYQQRNSSSEESYTESLTSNWTYWCVTRTGSVWSIYKNGHTAVNQVTLSNEINTSASQLGVGCRHQTGTDNLDGYLSEMIIENAARTVQEVSNYYNQTKGNYGL